MIRTKLSMKEMKFAMKKKLILLCLCFCVFLSSCGMYTTRTVSENRLDSEETELPEMVLSEEERAFIDAYSECFAAEDAKRTALLYLDEDTVPELLILKDGEYRLYSFDGSGAKAIPMPDEGIRANAYGLQQNFTGGDYQAFYWFEYVPGGGLIRVHGSTGEERDDYYLKYAGGSFQVELEVTGGKYGSWHTFDAEDEISNEEFLSLRARLGYDGLLPCAYLYENVEAAYRNIGAASDTDARRVLEDFMEGKIDAVDYVEGVSDIPEEAFVMRCYKAFYDDVTSGEKFWGGTEFIDFDNDGEDELLIHGYVGACLFFDVIGDTVYRVLHTGSTTDVAHVAEFEGRRVIARTDLTHGGRKCYSIMEFDPCCCLIDWFNLDVFYEGQYYTEDDQFEYRDREITMEEFEEIEDRIGYVDHDPNPPVIIYFP